MEPPPPAPNPSAGLNVTTAGIAQVFHGHVTTLNVSPNFARGLQAIDPQLLSDSAAPGHAARAAGAGSQSTAGTPSPAQTRRTTAQGDPQQNRSATLQQQHDSHEHEPDGLPGSRPSAGPSEHQPTQAGRTSTTSGPKVNPAKAQKNGNKTHAAHPKSKFSSTTKGKVLPRLWKKEHDDVLAKVCADIDDIVNRAQELTGASSSAIRSHCLSASRLRRAISPWNMLIQYMSRKPDIVRRYYHNIPDKKTDGEGSVALPLPQLEDGQTWNDFVRSALQPFWRRLKVEDNPTFVLVTQWLLTLKSLTVAKILTDDVYEKMRQEKKYLCQRAADLEANEAIVQVAFLVHPDPLIEPTAAVTPFGQRLLSHLMARWRPGDTSGHFLARMRSAVQDHAPVAYLALGDAVRDFDDADATPSHSPSAQVPPRSSIGIPPSLSSGPSSTSATSAVPAPAPTPAVPPPMVPSRCRRTQLPVHHTELVPYVARQLLALLTAQIWTLSEKADSSGRDLYDFWLVETQLGSQIPYVRLFDVLRSRNLCLDGWPKAAEGLLLNAETIDGIRDDTLEIYAGGMLNTASWTDKHAFAIADAIALGHLGVEHHYSLAAMVP
ncbi:hypothetical protein OC842_006691 [Tilletia horrida]|uniref:Uncharacterized protein n=1 Tax=Tilletia horrida TaxID=155126 RepID=A0AAN6JHD3_9BASI|nr:hypothetical protein OC842_006691 [Tilletia horrida]